MTSLTPHDGVDSAPARDPRRWVTLAVVVFAALILVLDTSVLTVAIPTIMRDFHTTLPAVEWVITGYALVFASLLIIGGRLGDLFGHRRIFIIGAALFGSGSLLAACSWNVASLIVGEAIIEGMGAAIMLPATMSVISTTFEGRERATAFAAWGATAGLGVALGPVLGGVLTTNLSWRWAFGINVIVAPLAVCGALAFIAPDRATTKRTRIDVPGACLVAAGMFLFVFGLTEGSRYGWFRPLEPFTVAGADVWPRARPVSVVPLAMSLAMVLLYAFYRLERWKEREDRAPLLEFGLLRHRSFRYGLITTGVLAMGQLSVFVVLALFLQDAKNLTAETTGLWLLPSGVAIIVGAQFGGHMTRHLGPVRIARIGLVALTLGIVMLAFTLDPAMTFAELLVGVCLFGVGVGFANSQLMNVVLSDIPHGKTGVASGTNSTVRQVGSALGLALVGSVFATLATRHAIDAVRSSGLPGRLRDTAAAGIQTQGVGFRAPDAASSADVATLHHALASGITEAARPALLLAAGCVACGVVLSFLLPRARVAGFAAPAPLADPLVVLDPVDADAETVSARES